MIELFFRCLARPSFLKDMMKKKLNQHLFSNFIRYLVFSNKIINGNGFIGDFTPKLRGGPKNF